MQTLCALMLFLIGLCAPVLCEQPPASDSPPPLPADPESELKVTLEETARIATEELAEGAKQRLRLLEYSPPEPKEKRSFEQCPPVVSTIALEKLNPETVYLLISLTKQRAYLMDGHQIVIDTPVSSGTNERATPVGRFRISQKSLEFKLPYYGDYLDSKKQKVRSGIDTRFDFAPSGTHFISRSKQYFLQFDEQNQLGIYGEKLPGCQSTNGDVRLPHAAAINIFKAMKIGDLVEIVK